MPLVFLFLNVKVIYKVIYKVRMFAPHRVAMRGNILFVNIEDANLAAVKRKVLECRGLDWIVQ